MELEFEGEIWSWRGPSPFHFVTVPAAQGAEIAAVARRVTYGWGVIPVKASIGLSQGRTLPGAAQGSRAQG